ncbi:MAG: MMPL family transporter [Treponema sp.]|jgi:predicted exporter|nr:MMPL family transporter [Treponema sp.]
MKKLFFPSPEWSRRRGGWLWLLAHLAVPLLLVASVFFAGPPRVNTALFDILPKSGQSKAVMEADAVLGEKNGREIVILAAAADFETAKKGAALLCAEFEDSPDLEKSSLYFDSSVMADFSRYLYDWRFVIAEKETLALLEGGGAETIAQDALASAFSAFNFIPLDNIEHDPFFLAERRMEALLGSSLLSGGNLSLKEDVLAAEKDGIWHILLRMTLAPGAVSVSGGKNVIGKIYAASSALKESLPGLELYFSGIPFHSYESSSGAQNEISFISTVTLIIILALFLFVFRSPLPVIASIAAAGVSIGTAAASALLIFREVHIITFVFGTTLIGTCVDYAVHYFVHWKGNPALKDGAGIRSHIAKSIIMCVTSTEICFFAFLLAPFPILKQFAVFSMAGLLSSFLTAFFVYPRLKMPKDEKRYFQFFKGKFFPHIIGLPQTARVIIVVILALAGLTVVIANFSSVKIKNDLSSLYTMSPTLLESEKRAAQVMNYGSPGWYFIVSGAGPEETLEREEQLAARLEEEIARGSLGSFLGTSVFAPSIKTQQKTYEAMKALLPLVPSQFEYLGFPPEYADSFYHELSAAATRYCLPEDCPSQAGVGNLWMERGGNCYSCVLPLHPAVDETVFRAIAGEFEFVHFINKAKDIGRDLDTLTMTMMIFFFAAYLVISVIICRVYPWRDSVKICAAPPFLALTALAVLAFNKIPLGFFSAAALILVFGLGLDYIFYMVEKKREETARLTRLAVVLSFLTTLLSFGALALSSFVPTRIFGLTVSAGLSGAFVFAMLLQDRVYDADATLPK